MTLLATGIEVSELTWDLLFEAKECGFTDVHIIDCKQGLVHVWLLAKGILFLASSKRYGAMNTNQTTLNIIPQSFSSFKDLTIGEYNLKEI